MPTNIDTALKTVQIVFYLTTVIIGILTYINARKGLLNPINTEYQKKVINRLEQLSDDLSTEFVLGPWNQWGDYLSISKIVGHIDEVFKSRKEVWLKRGNFFTGFTFPEKFSTLQILLTKTKSDPFVPSGIREKVTDMLDNTINVFFEVLNQELSKYMNELAQGEHQDFAFNDMTVETRINNSLKERGCHVEQLEKEIHEVRLEIQDYFESFMPIKLYKDRREKVPPLIR